MRKFGFYLLTLVITGGLFISSAKAATPNVVVTTAIVPTALAGGGTIAANTVPAGDTGNVVITLTNDATGTTANVTLVTVTLPAQMPLGTVATAQAGGFTATVGGQTVNFTTGTVTNGTPITLMIPYATATNLANMTTLTIGPPTVSLAGATATPAPTGATATSTVITDFSVVLTSAANPTGFFAGSSRVVTMTIVNNGPSDAPTANYVNMPYSTSLSPTPSPTQGAVGVGMPGGTVAASNVGIFGGAVFVQFTTAPFPAKGTAIITFTEAAPKTAAAFTFSDVAQVNQSLGPPNAIEVDPVTTNNTSTLPLNVTPNADLSVVITANTGSGTTPGTLVNRNLTISVTNNGPSVASDVVLTKNAAPGTTFVSPFMQSAAAPSFTPSGSPINTWTLPAAAGTLDVGVTKTFTYLESIPANKIDAIVDTATVSSSTPDSVSTNNTFTLSTPVTIIADLQVQLVQLLGPNTNVVAGSNVTYTVRVNNNAGPSYAPCTLSDIFQGTSLMLVSQVAVGATVFTLGTDVNGNIVDTGILPPNTPQILTITAKIRPDVPSGTSIVNSVKMTLTTGTDSLPSNDTGFSGALTTAVSSDIQYTITTSPPGQTSAISGGTLTYLVSVTNAGLSDNQAVSLPTGVGAMIVPTGTTLNSITSSTTSPVGTGTPFTFDPAVYIPGYTGTISAPAVVIPAGTTNSFLLTLNITATPPATISLSGSAALGTPAQDPNLGNNSATLNNVSVIVNSDVAITGLTVPPNVVPPGDVTYSFNVVNTGPSLAQTVRLQDMLPAGTTFKSLFMNGADKMTTAPGNILNFLIGDIPVGTSIPFVLTISVPSNFSLSTLSNTIFANVPANDLNQANNTVTQVTPVGALADLGIGVTTNATANGIVVGNDLIYTITISNAGPSNAANPTFTFPFPAGGGAIYKSVSIPNGWAQTSTNNPGDTTGSFLATTPSMSPQPAADSTATFTLTYSIPLLSSGSLVNSPVVSSPTNDTNTANNTATNMGSTTTYTVPIAPQPKVSIVSFNTPEGDVGLGNALAVFTLSGPSPVQVTVDFTTQDDTALSPKDYLSQTGTVIFQPGDTSKTVPIQIVGNTIVDVDRQFKIVLSKAVNTTIDQNNAIVTINNDDRGGTLHFTVANYDAPENAGTATITVARNVGETASGITVAYATSDGTAAAGSDYTAVSGVLTFAAGQLTQTFTVPLLNKVGALSAATVNLTLSNPTTSPNNVPGSNATLGAQRTATLTILGGPSILPPLNIAGLVNMQLSYTLNATGATPITYALGPNAALPHGLTFTPGVGAFTGIPTVVGTFAIPVIATNPIGSDPETLVITISAQPGVSPSQTLLDSDGDGFPDELEVAIGSDPFDATSTPLNIKQVQVASIANLKLAIALNFAKKGNDTVTMSGQVLLPDDFAQSGKLVYFDIGGIIRRFALDLTGSNKVGSDSVKFSLGKIKKTTSATTSLAKFTLNIRKGDFQTITATQTAPLLDDEGLTNATVIKGARIVPVMLLLNSSLYTVSQHQVYTAKVGKTGKSKNP